MGTCGSWVLYCFFNNKKTITILHRELKLKVEKVKVHEVGGHTTEDGDQKEYEFPA